MIALKQQFGASLLLQASLKRQFQDNKSLSSLYLNHIKKKDELEEKGVSNLSRSWNVVFSLYITI